MAVSNIHPSSIPYAKKAHVSVSRGLEATLTTNNLKGWKMWISLILLRLDDEERIALAASCLQALHPDHRISVVEHALPTCTAGAPIAPLFNFMDEAAFWADLACSKELAAYCLAAFNRMTEKRQIDFLSYVEGRTAA